MHWRMIFTTPLRNEHVGSVQGDHKSRCCSGYSNLLTLIHHHYGIETHTVDFKRAIVTTDKRNTRKNASYQPNEKTTAKDQYRTKSVKVNRYKEASVHLGALLR